MSDETDGLGPLVEFAAALDLFAQLTPEHKTAILNTCPLPQARAVPCDKCPHRHKCERYRMALAVRADK